jgi:hypothetical protein
VTAHISDDDISLHVSNRQNRISVSVQQAVTVDAECRPSCAPARRTVRIVVSEVERDLLKKLAPDAMVEGVYQTAHKDCRFDGRKLPQAAAIQQLVAAWKVLRRMHRAK